MKQEMRKVIKNSRKLFIIKFLVSCCLRATVLLIPFFYSYTIDKFASTKFNEAYIFCTLLLVFTILYHLAEMLNDYVYEKLYKKLYLDIVKVELELTENNSIHSLSRITLPQYNCIMTSDVNVTADCYASVPMLIARIIEALCVFYYFFSINIYIGSLSVIVSILVMIILYLGNKKVNYINSLDKSSHDQRLGIIQEYFLGIKEVKGFRLFPSINRRIQKSYDVYQNWHTRYGLYKVILKYGALCIIEGSKIIFLFYGLFLASKNEMSLAVILLVYSYFGKLSDNFTGILDFNNQWQNMKVSVERMFTLKEYAHEEEKVENEKIISRGVIDLEDIVYGNKNDPILNHFTAHINSRSITVITGVTGSGKTGVFDLLLKLNKPHEGKILIDHIDINEYADDIYFSSVAAVRKNPTFFHMSIRDNLEILEKDFEKVIEVCKELGVHEQVMKLPNGYDTIISESASNVTSTIRYLLSIVRVVLKNPKVLLFDETLNAFNKETDLQILDYFKTTKQQHNVVVISNEKHIIEASDQVIYMTKGQVSTSGKHEVLLHKNKEYKEYFNTL